MSSRQPVTPSSPQLRTPLHAWHAAHGARFADRDGWLVPAVYSGVEQETTAVRSGLGLADVSAFAKVSLRGPGVPALSWELFGDGLASRPRGVSTYATGTDLACRLTDDHLLLLETTAAAFGDLPESTSVIKSDSTAAWAGFWLLGVRSDEALRRLTPLEVSPAALPPGACAETGVAGVQALLVRPPALPLSVLGVYVSWELGEYLWERLLEDGRGIRPTPVGLKTLEGLLQSGSRPGEPGA
jgi:glycine cleavage system aminomethyltransferase T